MNSRKTHSPLATIGFVVALLVGAYIIAALVGVFRVTPCDDVRFRSAVSPAGKESASNPPAIGEDRLRRTLRDAFRRDSPAVFCNDFPDPFVLRVGGVVGDRYYAFSTNTAGLKVPVLASGGLFKGSARQEALGQLAPWAAADTVWAPAVGRFDNTFVMYYSTRPNNASHKCLSVATSEDPAGPYVDQTAGPLVCEAIDASPSFDHNGTPYLVWSSDRGAAIQVSQLSPDGRHLVGPRHTLISASQGWEGGIVEAPSMIEHEGRFYLFYSGNEWQTANYAIGYAVCTTPIGPCQKPLGGPWIASNALAQGPGGEELFLDGGGNLWMALHAWVHGQIGYQAGARHLFVLKLEFLNGAPYPA